MNTRKEESIMLVRLSRPLLIGLVAGALTVLVTLAILAATATAYDIPSAAVVPLATVANALGAFVGGFVCARINKRNGWLSGLLSALVLFLFSTAAGFGLYSQIDGVFLTVKALIMLACGMVGGIFAVNTGKHHKR